MKRMPLTLRTLFVCFFFLLVGESVALRALDPDRKITQYLLHVWDMDSGLPGNAVFALRQTSDGYLWIGTQDGLVRFDGVDFEIYTRDTVPQLRSNDVRALYEYRSGVLWIGSFTNGLTCFKKDRFITYTTKQRITRQPGEIHVYG
jgi:ligand-binding sensor domain-containing protein